MRLSKFEIDSIKEVTKSVFGEDATAILFGSRLDNNKKGGDIDLLIKCNKRISFAEKYQLKLKFLLEIKKLIGDQRIDVLIETVNLKTRIFDTVNNGGSELWCRFKIYEIKNWTHSLIMDL